MATNPKAQDPSASALSAIEEALSLAAPDNKAGTNDPQLPRIDEDKDLARRASALPPEPSLEASRRKADSVDAVIPSSKPANDDRRSVGQILQALQYRPSNTPLVLAGVASALWVVLTALYVSSEPALTRGQMALYALAAIGPCLFFFLSAALMRRVQEMHHTARSMSEVAIRLADPESFTTEQVMMLSQAIRRELASMGDGVERALARAGELEMLVHNEVSNLERSYSDNERRIRKQLSAMPTACVRLLRWRRKPSRANSRLPLVASPNK